MQIELYKNLIQPVTGIVKVKVLVCNKQWAMGNGPYIFVRVAAGKSIYNTSTLKFIL